MYTWGPKSREVRGTLHWKLQVVVDELLKWVDVSLISGHRGKEEQDRYNDEGVSQVRWPNSKHNKNPSHAVDLQPYPYPENENDLRAALGYIAGLAMKIADNRGWRLRWGGDWNRNGSVVDNGFDDLFHLELIDEEAISRAGGHDPDGGGWGTNR